MPADAHKNFAYAVTTNAPGAGGTSVTITAGKGALFPAAPFNISVWPSGAQALSTNCEIMRVTARVSDTLTVTRNQEGSTNRNVVIGDQVAATITAKSFTDIENKPSNRVFNRANFI